MKLKKKQEKATRVDGLNEKEDIPLLVEKIGHEKEL